MVSKALHAEFFTDYDRAVEAERPSVALMH